VKYVVAAWLFAAYALPVAFVLAVPADKWPGFEPQPTVTLMVWLSFATLVTAVFGSLLFAKRRH